ncbi:hypothetical protein K438DRAFT_1791460 [Mycena galopus ATCC 62051]|nr:hypothetical protein K438DRAFT_1791460 [Mycena galopus ATCC 62051]
MTSDERADRMRWGYRRRSARRTPCAIAAARRDIEKRRDFEACALGNAEVCLWGRGQSRAGRGGRWVMSGERERGQCARPDSDHQRTRSVRRRSSAQSVHPPPQFLSQSNQVVKQAVQDTTSQCKSPQSALDGKGGIEPYPTVRETSSRSRERDGCIRLGAAFLSSGGGSKKAEARRSQKDYHYPYRAQYPEDYLKWGTKKIEKYRIMLVVMSESHPVYAMTLSTSGGTRIRLACAISEAYFGCYAEQHLYLAFIATHPDFRRACIAPIT